MSQRSKDNSNFYPKQLIESEITAHKYAINEYQKDLSYNLFQMANSLKPDINLIKLQPELNLKLRVVLLNFLFKIAIKIKVSTGIYYKAVKLFDRYCSKRIVLKSQAQLVICTALWIAAKVSGGCNHIINSINLPTGNRYIGPSKRARIPKLIEFVQLCGPDCHYDTGMFIQMERHILTTLNWDVTEPSVYNWCFSL
ncbi:cyclin-like protein, partial [Ascoidea rubescens DSM 1968]